MISNSDQASAHINRSTSLPSSIQAWKIYLMDQDKSEYTVKAFMGDMSLLTRFFPPDITIGEITTNDLNRFIEWLENGRGKGIPCSAKSLARRITSIKSFFRWLSENGRISADPAESIVQRSVISPLPEVLNSEERKKVLETAQGMSEGLNPDVRPYVLLKLLLETGIKKSECLNIKLPHFILGNGEKYLFVRYPDQKDRNKERKIPVSDVWAIKYQEYLEQYGPKDWVFPWSPRRLEYILEDICKAAGIEKHLSFSMCRWNSALDDWMEGINRDKIRQKLGVSKIQWREISMKLKKLAAEYK